MDLGLQDDVVVMIGGARGIGQAIAQAFADEKAKVAIVDREASVVETAQAMQGKGYVGDVTDYAQMQEIAQAIQNDFGRIDHVVFAVAIGSGKFGFPFWNLEPSDWANLYEVNVLGAVHVAHAFVPALLQAPRGTMLFLASVAGQMGSQTDPPYSASKAALINFAQCAAKDLAPRGVRVNTLCPGMIKTPLNRSVWQAWHDRQPPEARKSYDEWAGEKIQQVVPMGRWQDPEDVAAMAVFLASERAKNVAGQTINVDGGFVMHW